jgi:hypothetical protein
MPTAKNTASDAVQLRRIAHSTTPATNATAATAQAAAAKCTANKIPALMPATTGSAGTYDNGGFTALSYALLNG